tara:strand:- start:782 stop:1504 length:723 start_codon:yes stop_codon:yes gene_type:complete
MRTILISLALCVACSGCATVVGGSEQSVTITSDPPGASLVITPGNIIATTPTKVELDRSYDYVVTFDTPGYEKLSVRLNRSISDSAHVNSYFPFVGFVGLATDALTDAEFTLVPDPLRVSLTPVGSDTTQSPESQGYSPTKVKFFNRNESGSAVYFQLDSGSVCKLSGGQFVVLELPYQTYDLYVYHWDIFKFSDEYRVHIDSSTTHVGILSGIGSTNYSIYDDFPTVDFPFNEVDCSDE